MAREISLFTGDGDLGIWNGRSARVIDGALNRTAKCLRVEQAGAESESRDSSYNRSKHHDPSG
jgi:hypothetical protein